MQNKYRSNFKLLIYILCFPFCGLAYYAAFQWVGSDDSSGIIFLKVGIIVVMLFASVIFIGRKLGLKPEENIKV
jgi:TRAP-type C4-dicarboxylate transport system permease small subunit